MNYKLVSCKTILSKLYRDLKPGISSWETDAIEWIGEVVEFIGFTGIFPKKTVTLKVRDFKAAFPCDFYQLIEVVYKGERLPYGEAFEQTDYLASTSYDVHQAKNPDFPNVVSRFVHDLPKPQGNYYLINSGNILTSFEHGEIELVYDAFSVDEDGYPMIPDNIYFKDAAFWYVLKQMILGGYTQTPIKYEYANTSWLIAKTKAENELAFPTPEKAEHFRNMWVRMIPHINEKQHSEYYKT